MELVNGGGERMGGKKGRYRGQHMRERRENGIFYARDNDYTYGGRGGRRWQRENVHNKEGEVVSE